MVLLYVHYLIRNQLEEEKIKFFKKENSYLNKKLDKMDAVVDRQVQYSRRNCFLVHGIVKETVEDTDEKIINTLQLNLKILIDHTGLASLTPPKMPNLVQ